MNPLKPIVRKVKSSEASLQKFAKGLRSSYNKSWNAWASSPEYKKAQKKATYEG